MRLALVLSLLTPMACQGGGTPPSAAPPGDAKAPTPASVNAATTSPAPIATASPIAPETTASAPETAEEEVALPPAFAASLTQVTHAPVKILSAVDTPQGVVVAYRFNTLEAHLGALPPLERQRVTKDLETRTRTCEDQRQADMANAEAWVRERIEGSIPCEVAAALPLVPRPKGPRGKGDFSSEPPEQLSARCDALGIALLTAEGALRAHTRLTHESCVALVERLRLEDFTGGPSPQVVVTATHEERREPPWGWGVHVSERRLTALDVSGGALTEVLSLRLDEVEYLESVLRSTCRYTIDAPGVVTRYSEAWNSLSGGIEVDRVQWDKTRRTWGEPKTVEFSGDSIPEHALPRDRPDE